MYQAITKKINERFDGTIIGKVIPKFLTSNVIVKFEAQIIVIEIIKFLFA